MFVLISFTKNSLPDEPNCKYFRFNKILEPLIITTIQAIDLLNFYFRRAIN